MTTKGNSAWDKLCALVAKQPDTAKCNTEHGLTQLSTGLAVMSLSAVPKILKTPNTSNFPNDSAEQQARLATTWCRSTICPQRTKCPDWLVLTSPRPSSTVLICPQCTKCPDWLVLTSPRLSSPVLTCPFLSFPVLSCLYLSFPVLSCPYQSSPVLSCPHLSFPVLSCPYLSSPVLTCPHLSLPILTYPYLSLVVLSCP